MDPVHESGCDTKLYLSPDEYRLVFLNTNGKNKCDDFVR